MPAGEVWALSYRSEGIGKAWTELGRVSYTKNAPLKKMWRWCIGWLWREGRPVRRPHSSWLWQFCFFSPIHSKHGGFQVKFLGHRFDHITLLLKCPQRFPALSGSFAGSAVALVITLQTTFPALSPPPPFQEPPIGTHRFSIFSNTTWEIVLIAISLAFCMLMLAFVALLFPYMYCLHCLLLVNQQLAWFLL